MHRARAWGRERLAVDSSEGCTPDNAVVVLPPGCARDHREVVPCGAIELCNLAWGEHPFPCNGVGVDIALPVLHFNRLLGVELIDVLEIGFPVESYYDVSLATRSRALVPMHSRAVIEE